jgi:FG-GAP-like repeat
MRKTLRLIALAAQLGALAACDPIEQLPRDRCGNTVIEQGEDCDGAGFGDSVCNELCRLECTAEGACPPGWGCGQDGLCRQPTGAFRPLGNSLAVSAVRLTLADIDGDGARDILAADDSGVTVAFAEAGGLSPQTLRVSSAPIDADPDVPAAGDIDGDGRADLALRLGASTGILRGQRDRTLAPQVFSRRLAIPTGDDLLFAFNADQRKASSGDEIFSIGQSGVSVVHTSNEVDFPAAPILTWPGSEKPVLLSSSGFVVYSFDGSSEVHSYIPFLSQGNVLGMWNQDAASSLSARARCPRA